MGEPVEYRLYETMLELLFDIERLIPNTVVKSIFYHFHKSTFKDHVVKPYAISYNTNTDANKTILLYDDILNIFGYIPTYYTRSNIKADLAYVDINNTLNVVPKNMQLAVSLMELFTKSSDQESARNLSKIPDKIINTVLVAIGDMNPREDNDFIHVGNFKIAKKLTPRMTDNLIIPTDIDVYDDCFQCIGYFSIYNNKNVSNRRDVNLALLTACSSCGKTIIVNYEQGSACHHCGVHNVI